MQSNTVIDAMSLCLCSRLMGSDAFRSLYTLYQSKTRMSEHIELLEQLKRRLSATETSEHVAGSSSANTEPSTLPVSVEYLVELHAVHKDNVHASK